MTPEELDRLEALASKATKGPWKTHTVDDTCIMSDQYDVATTCDSSNTERDDAYNVEYERMEDDAAFIAACREAVPALIAEVRRLREAQQWQPIETAPRDGTKVLTYWWDRGVRSGDQVEAYFNKKTKRWETEMTVAQADYHPTHWMPLPNPPVQS